MRMLQRVGVAVVVALTVVAPAVLGGGYVVQGVRDAYQLDKATDCVDRADRSAAKWACIDRYYEWRDRQLWVP